MSPSPTRRAAVLAAALAGCLSAAQADSGTMLPRTTPPAYAQECAACHVAYPPGLLPASSWQRIMGGLGRHYGSDASIDPATQQQLVAWLQANAGTYKRVAEAPPQDRITLSAWFARKHRAMAPAIWQHTSVKSAANCTACHTGADKGAYNDDVRLPAGIDARLRRAWNE